MDRRTITTLCGLLRRHADETLRQHGKLSQRPGGIGLTPNEIEELADALESGEVILTVEDLLS